MEVHKEKNEITAKIFYLFFVIGFTYKTIANDMKMTESSVKIIYTELKKN